MSLAEFLQQMDRPLRGISLGELRAVRVRLAESRGEYEARLAEIEARERVLFDEGASRRDVRGHRLRAGQIAVLENEANGLAALLRLTHKQLILADRLIWLRENLDALNRLRKDVPGLPLDWPALLDATEALDDEARLDRLNAALAAQTTEAGAGVAIDGGEPEPGPTADGAGRPARPALPLVTRVLDGATIELEDGRRVRYIGVDSPTLANLLGRADMGAEAARAANEALVGNQRVRLEGDDLDRDADGALWRYVYVGNRFVNAELIRGGAVCYVGRYPNNRHARVLAAVEQDARRHRRGLWCN